MDTLWASMTIVLIFILFTTVVLYTMYLRDKYNYDMMSRYVAPSPAPTSPSSKSAIS